MSSSSPSMSAMEMEESSDTSREDRHNNKSRVHRPTSALQQQKHRQSVRHLSRPPASPVGSLSYGGLPAGVYVSGSPYATSVRDQPISGSVPTYSVWGSDSSQLYRSGSSKDKDKKQVCSTLLITTATLVVMAVLAIAAIAAYLGVMTNHSDGDKYEIQFDCSMRIIQGDNFRQSLTDPISQQFITKSERYRRLVDTVYKASPLSDSFRRCSIERFTNGSLVVHFRLFFDRRKIPAQIGETESTVQDVMIQEVMAVEPVAFKSVVIDIDSIHVHRFIPVPDVSSQRSQRLQNKENFEEEEEEEEGNGLDEQDVQPVIVHPTNLPSTTTANVETDAVTTDSDVNGSDNDENLEQMTSPVPIEVKSTTVTTEIPTVKSVVSTQDPKLVYDDSEWKPIFVPTRTTGGDSLSTPDTKAAAAIPAEEVVGDYESESYDEDAEPSVTDLDAKGDRIMAVVEKDKAAETDNQETSSPATASNNKFSFLQWFNAQLSNVKLAQNRLQFNSTVPPIITIGGGNNNGAGGSSTRFFTLKPTAVSYSGIQPILRPKPWEPDNSTETIPVANRSMAEGFILPRPFQVQTSLTLAREPGKLVESPRSSKSLPLAENVRSRSNTTPRALERVEQRDDLLKDFFPPVRRPVARPQTSKSGLLSPENQAGSLPIEGLFSTLSPAGDAEGQRSSTSTNSQQHRSTNTNSPIYTFKLNQGQTVHDVLSQLLADLTVGESPAEVEIDGAAPSLTLAQQQQQQQQKEKQDNTDNIKVSNKKVDDDRLKPWTHMPFRPAVLNALYNTRHNSTNVEAPTTPGSAAEDATVTTDVLIIGNSCGADQFQCSNGECVSGLARCNQMSDCRDGSDELNCTCADFLRAQFLNRKICDGIIDCWDYSDENQCEWCRPGQYICPNSKVCIDRNLICNGIRECPNGDDERHCIALAHHVDSTEEMSYSNSGYLMVRREGRWGKLCMQNFDSAVEKLRQSFQVNDLGKAVCRELTFTGLERAEKKLDSSRSSQDSTYYELVESDNESHDYENIEDEDGHEFVESSRASMLDYTTSKCAKRQVVHVQCRDLECGIRPQLVSTRARIVGGANSTPGAWPWQAALYKEGDFQCGATLISSQWLVSAGHCFYHAQDDHWVARLGALRRGSNLLSPHEQVRVISHIFIHPAYIDTGFVNDISILRMEEPVRFTDYIRPVCLPPPTADIRDGRLCTVVGWGQLYETGRIFPDTLQQVQLPLVSTEECRKRTLFLPLYRLTNNMFCAGFDRGGRDACLGDSGGPLMCEEPDGRWTLQGVTSNGYGCARANRPGVYTKVARYVTWIDQVVNGTYRHPRRPSQCSNGHRCLLGQCLPRSHVCNGIVDCSDGSDERNCTPAAL